MTTAQASGKSPSTANVTTEARAGSTFADQPTAMKKHSVLVAGHATSISLENVFWQELKAIAGSRNMPLNRLITEIDRSRRGNLSSAIRVFVLESLRARR